ncbi:hypothetical protein [Nocardia arizonensis]|uniref:hypothetical protein n=1 Tax=Nocardia arizonensis TaxID=1141647 RepID=UPI0006D01DA3|nr:hypothetical protein [Nocardia arizonensis]
MSAPDDAPLTDDERRELLRLRREVDDLRRAHGADTGARPGHPRLRWTGVAILLALAAALAFAAVPARYLHGELLDTDRYVRTVTPLAADPVLRAELTDRLTDELMARLDVEAATAEALTTLTRDAPRVPAAVVGLAPVIADEAESFVRDRVAAFLASDRFEALWIQANRQAHRTLVAVLTGETRDGVRIDDGTVALDLGPVIDAVRTDLIGRGFSFAENIPDVDATVVLIESPRLATARRLTSALDTSSTVLPAAALLAAVAAVLLAPRGSRRRALVLAGVVLAATMVLLGIVTAIGRAVYLREIPPDALSRDSAAIVFDTLARPLRTAVRAVFVLATVLAAVGYLAGPSRTAIALRRGYTAALDAVRAPRPGRVPHRIESAVAALRIPLRIAIVAAAAITVVFWDYPSGLVVTVIVLVAVAALLLVELVARPARPRPE